MPRRKILKPQETKKTVVKKTVTRTPSKPAARRKPSAKRVTIDTPRTVNEPLVTMTPPPPKSHAPVASRRAMSSIECFFYGGVICLVGTIALGLLLGLVVLPPLVAKYAQYSYAAPMPDGDPGTLQSPTVSQQIERQNNEPAYGFYGTLLSKEADVLTVQELLPPLPLEKESAPQPTQKIFIVRVNNATEYTHQKPRGKDNLTAPLFSPEQGSLEQMSPNMYVFVNTTNDPTGNDTVDSSHILYSELSPFSE